MTTKLEGALVVGPLKKTFFTSSLNQKNKRHLKEKER